MPPKGRGPPSRGTFNCPDCDRPFSRKEYVERHRRLKHLGSRPFGCDDCGNSFARSDLLRRHRKTCSSVPGAVPKGGKQPRHDDEDEIEDDLDDLTSLAFAVTDAFPNGPSTSHPFSYPSVSSTSTFSPILPSLSPPGDSSGSSATSANSPDTPGQVYSAPDLGVASYQQHYPDPTLAPSLSSMSHNTLTSDEILASEVLEDLLRSPQYSRYTPTLESLESDENATSAVPWHGALAPQNAGNESTEVMGQWDGGGFNQDNGDYNGIEFTPEAMALADYFNKGGVGGISALDLGFQYTPSLYPDHLFEPNEPVLDDERFFLPSQRFCVGYLYPWHVPPIKTLSRFAKLAATSFLPSIPVVHPASMVMAELPTHTAFALTVTGAAYEADGEQFSNEMLVEKRVFLVRGFNKAENTDDDKFASLQSMLLYQLLGLFHREEQQRLLSHTFHGALVMMLRQLSLPEKVRQASLVPVHTGLRGEELDLAWKEWVKVETRRRVAFIVYLSDLETATTFDTAPLLPFAELAIDLPASGPLWNAKSPSDWLQKSLAAAHVPPVPFLDAIRALLSSSPPPPYSTDGLILASLANLSSFPLLILSRTLSFLQMKTEEAIRQVDPFRTLLGGVGLFDGKENENRDVLRRIVNGRELLKVLPGGVKRGGGEKWFEGVMPHGADSQAAPLAPVSPISPSVSDNPFFTKHVKSAAAKVTQDWPDFMQ